MYEEKIKLKSIEDSILIIEESINSKKVEIRGLKQILKDIEINTLEHMYEKNKDFSEILKSLHLYEKELNSSIVNYNNDSNNEYNNNVTNKNHSLCEKGQILLQCGHHICVDCIINKKLIYGDKKVIRCELCKGLNQRIGIYSFIIDYFTLKCKCRATINRPMPVRFDIKKNGNINL